MSTLVQSLIDQIQNLSEEQLEEFELEMAALERRRFDAMTADLRADVKARGLTEEDLDRMCDEVRYGRTPPSDPTP